MALAGRVRTYHLATRKQWGRDIIIYELPPRNDDNGIFDPQLVSGKYSDRATGGGFSHAWGSDFVEIKQSLLPNIIYWQNKGFDYLKSGDTISIACHVETPLDNWGDDFTDGAEYTVPEYTLEVGSVTGTVKKAMDNSALPGLQIQINYPMLMADDAVKKSYGDISAIPSTFVVDKKGIVRYTYLGVPGDKLAFQRHVEELLAQ